MAPTLLQGDWVLVNKWSTGAQLINLKELFLKQRLQYSRVFESTIKKNDLLVFNFPIHTTRQHAIVYGQAIVKRCYAVAGDTVLINRQQDTFHNQQGEISIFSDPSTLLYPFDKELNWTTNSYGPLWVPKKGVQLLADSTFQQHYERVFCMENHFISDSDLSSNGNRGDFDAFQHNYYFMLGDNFYESQDSRFWGFVPETHIIGKAVYVLFSFDPRSSWYRSFVWNRLLKHVE